MSDFDKRFDEAITKHVSNRGTDCSVWANWSRPALKAAYKLKQHRVMSRAEIEQVCTEIFTEIEKLLGGEE